MITDKISKLFDFISETNLIEEYFYEHKGQYPVFSGQTENNGIVTMIDTYNQEKDCVTMTTYGSAGKLYYRDGKYTIGRNCMGLIPKEEYKNKINLKWFSYKFQNLFYRLRIGDPQGQRSINQLLVENIKITIPDITIQERQLKLYEKAEKIQNKISKILTNFESVNNSKMNITDPIYNEKIKTVFTIDAGNSGLTSEFIYSNTPITNEEKIPIYSGATTYERSLGFISRNAKLNDGLKIFSSPSITVTRKGVYAGTMINIEKGDFTMNDNVYVMGVNNDWIGKVNLRWFIYQYQDLFKNLVTSKSDNATFSKEYAEEQFIQLPDIDFQNRIASKLHNVDNLTKGFNKINIELSDLMEHELI